MLRFDIVGSYMSELLLQRLEFTYQESAAGALALPISGIDSGRSCWASSSPLSTAGK
jgi:hypothetical protein